MTAKIMREARKQTDDVEAERDEFPLKTILQSQEASHFDTRKFDIPGLPLSFMPFF